MAVAIRVTRDDSGIIDIMPSADQEEWEEVVTAVAEADGTITGPRALKGWDPYDRLFELAIPIGGGWDIQYYMVGEDGAA